eukprot:TRINITY_DN4288_c0_g1_i4.p1 TRINITY_DN4288_c0_g1~~TRINITY_DN4288_c0_g1_i4.p1  ORF type:complete len:140 (-),score=2.12 TRINITY_DN4288_c0_g1_i4:103-522(-)
MIILASFGGLLTLGGVGQLFCYWDGIFRESGVVQLPVGVLLLFLSASCILAFMRGETWRLTINDGILSWSYPRWPKSVGAIDLSRVCKATIYHSGGNWLLVTFSDATTQRIMLVGSPHRVRDFLVNHCPHISMTFREYD